MSERCVEKLFSSCKKDILNYAIHFLSEWQMSEHYLHEQLIRTVKSAKLITAILSSSTIYSYTHLYNFTGTSLKCQSICLWCRWVMSGLCGKVIAIICFWILNQLSVHIILSLTWNSDSRWLFQMTLAFYSDSRCRFIDQTCTYKDYRSGFVVT